MPDTGATTDAPADAVVIERTFGAPRDLIWKMWTDPQHFSAWYGPNGASVPVAEMDVQVGGRRLIGMEMQTPNGPMRMWFTGEYREIVEPERLVYTESVADEQGNILPPSAMGMPDGHPVITEVTVVLAAVDGRTRMVMTHRGVPAGSPGAAGWEMALDKLSTHLQSQST